MAGLFPWSSSSPLLVNIRGMAEAESGAAVLALGVWMVGGGVDETRSSVQSIFPLTASLKATGCGDGQGSLSTATHRPVFICRCSSTGPN